MESVQNTDRENAGVTICRGHWGSACRRLRGYWVTKLFVMPSHVFCLLESVSQLLRVRDEEKQDEACCRFRGGR